MAEIVRFGPGAEPDRPETGMTNGSAPVTDQSKTSSPNPLLPNASQDERSGARPRRSLSLVDTGKLRRHPRDGFRRAKLFPMGPGSRRALKTLIVALCPSTPAPAGPQIQHHVEVAVRLWMAYMPRWLARVLWLSFFLIEWSPLWCGCGLRRLSNLPPRRRARVIARLTRNKFAVVRRLIFTLNGMLLCAYFDHAAVHRELGYAPVPFMLSRVELRKRLLSMGQAQTG